MKGRLAAHSWSVAPTLAHGGGEGAVERYVRLGASDLPRVTRSRQSRLNTSPHACSALTATPCANEPVLQENRTRDKYMKDRCGVPTATADPLFTSETRLSLVFFTFC